MRRFAFKTLAPLAAGLLLAAAPAAAAPSAPAPLSPAAASADAVPVLGLARALSLVVRYSPLVRAAAARAYGAREQARAAGSGYYPLLGASAVDSSGFPGSASGLEGFDGLVASPYRSGPSVDAFGTWNLVDATVWHAAAAADDEADAGREAQRIQEERAAADGLRVYLAAVLYRGDQQAWATLVDSLKGVRETVEKFVRNGQYSDVQRMLIEDQIDDAGIRGDDYGRQYALVLARLALLTDHHSDGTQCPPPGSLDEGALEAALKGGGESPLVLRADDEAAAARETAKRYSAENLPKVELGGSAGWLDNERLVRGQDYSAFAGVTLPLFEGFRIQADTRAAEGEEAARQAEAAEARLELADFNAQEDETIAEVRGDLARLLPEQRRAADAVALARQRYLQFLGPLSDLQQALKDRVTVDTEVAEDQTRLLLALGSKALVNGASVASEGGQ